MTEIIFEIVWEISLFSDLKTLCSIFCVCKSWSKVSEYDIFWSSYYRNIFHAPNPIFKEGSLQYNVKTSIDNDDVEELKNTGHGDLQKIRFPYAENKWIARILSVVDILQYAVIKGSVRVTECLIKCGIFKKPTSGSLQWSISADLLYLALVFSRRKIISKLFEIEYLDYTLPLYSVGFKKTMYGELIRRKKSPHLGENEEACYLSIPVLLRDLETFKVLIDRLSKDQLHRWCHVIPYRHFIYLACKLRRFEFVEYGIEHGAYYSELKRKRERYYDNVSEEIPEEITEKIERANERVKKMYEEKGGYPVYILTLTGKMIVVEGMKDEDSILELKMAYQEADGIPVDSQRLIYRGIELREDLRTLKDYLVGCHSYVHSVLRL